MIDSKICPPPPPLFLRSRLVQTQGVSGQEKCVSVKKEGEGEKEREAITTFPLGYWFFSLSRTCFNPGPHVWTVCQESMAQLYTEERCTRAACIRPAHKSDCAQSEEEGWANWEKVKGQEVVLNVLGLMWQLSERLASGRDWHGWPEA